MQRRELIAWICAVVLGGCGFITSYGWIVDRRKLNDANEAVNGYHARWKEAEDKLSRNDQKYTELSNAYDALDRQRLEDAAKVSAGEKVLSIEHKLRLKAEGDLSQTHAMNENLYNAYEKQRKEYIKLIDAYNRLCDVREMHAAYKATESRQAIVEAAENTRLTEEMLRELQRIRGEAEDTRYETARTRQETEEMNARQKAEQDRIDALRRERESRQRTIELERTYGIKPSK
jgi:chromosome segregation ATPase